MKAPIPRPGPIDLNAIDAFRIVPDGLRLRKDPLVIGSDKLRQVDPASFAAHGARIDWSKVARGEAQLGALRQNAAVLPIAVHLRWMISQTVGMPTEPFRVWQRVTTLTDFTPLDAPVRTWQVGAITTVQFARPIVKLWVWAVTGPAGAALSPIRRFPVLEGVELPRLMKGGGLTSIVISSPFMTGISFTGIVEIKGIAAITAADYPHLPDWELVEVAGLPAVPGAWGEHPGWTRPQGRGAQPQLDPPAAAAERLKRGAPPIGWPNMLPASGAAPAWTAPDPEMLVTEVNHPDFGILPRLRTAMQAPPDQQWQVKVPVSVQPTVINGLEVPPGDASVPPLGITQIAGTTDPFLALALGFGTALDEGTLPPDISFGSFSARLEHDYLVTARWERGFDGASPPRELAAPVPSPDAALPPPPPAHLRATSEGLKQPAGPDQPWLGTMQLLWDRLPKNSIVNVASMAAIRAGAATPDPFLEQRPSGGWRPIAANALRDAAGNELPTLRAIDPSLAVLAGDVTQLYGVAQQTLFGLWSDWSTCVGTLAVPPPQVPQIMSAKLEAVPGPSHDPPCDGTLVVELLIDWSVRRPARMQLVGRLFAATVKSAPPPDASRPDKLDRAVGLAGPGIDIVFAGDHPSAAGAAVTIVDPQSGAPAAEGAGVVRRYRLKVPGFSLDFAKGFVGITLFARATEIVGNRAGAWTGMTVARAADPRPPMPKPIPVPRLASLPDASGCAHVRLAWGDDPAAAGWFVYEATETAILAARGKPDPIPSQTLQDRLVVLQGILDGDPSRKVFTRRNAQPIQGTSVDLALARGSTVFHVFVVAAHSTGLVESAWPTSSAGMQIVAAPRLMVPAPPILEVRAAKAGGVEVRLETRPGPRVRTLHLFRTRNPDAARDVDAMGAPIAVIEGSAGAWKVTPEVVGADGIASATAIDHPPPSWRPWWYRALSWSGDDDTRGWRRARSGSSMAMSVLVPPPGPPPLDPITPFKPKAAKSIGIHWSTSAPVAPTPLGPHRVEVEVFGRPDAGFVARLGEAKEGLIRIGEEYSYVFSRPNPLEELRVTVRLIDPLGRVAEQMLVIPGTGKLQPLPVLNGAIGVAKPGGAELQLTLPADAGKGQTLSIGYVGKGGVPVSIDLPLAKIGARGGTKLPGGAVAARRIMPDGSAMLTVAVPYAVPSFAVAVTGETGETITRKVTPRW